MPAEARTFAFSEGCSKLSMRLLGCVDCEGARWSCYNGGLHCASTFVEL